MEPAIRPKPTASSDRPAPKFGKCRVCRRKFQRWLSTKVCCSTDCAIAYARNCGEKRQSLAMKRVALAEKREALERLKSLSECCSDTQVPVNAFVRMRDKHKGCISCESGRVDDAGHFFPIGSKWRISFLRFNTKLIHGQCRQCNSYTGGGNLHGYIEGIKRRYGDAYLAEMYEIKRLAEQGEERVTREDLVLIASEHRAKLRELRKERQ